MKQTLSFLTIVALAATTLLSCSKTDDPAPSNPPTNTTVDQSKLVNQWEVTSFYTLYYDTLGRVIDANGLSQSYTGYEAFWEAKYKTYVTFNSDNTLNHSNADGIQANDILSVYEMPVTGNWQLKTNNTVLSLPFNDGTSVRHDDFTVVDFNANYCHLIYANPALNSFNKKGVAQIELKR